MIDLAVVGGADVARTLDRLAPRLTQELGAGMSTLGARLVQAIRQDKLSGQVLKSRTGRLRQSIAMVADGDGATLSVGVVAPGGYAAAHEFGFRGTVTVRQHLRQIRQAFGRPIAPRTIAVKAHPIRIDLPARSFLRSALRDLDASGAIRAEIAAAIGRAGS
jgi:phage gpG-like protein